MQAFFVLFKLAPIRRAFITKPLENMWFSGILARHLQLLLKINFVNATFRKREKPQKSAFFNGFSTFT